MNGLFQRHGLARLFLSCLSGSELYVVAGVNGGAFLSCLSGSERRIGKGGERR